MLQNLIKNSILDFCFTGLYAGWSVKEAIDNFFCKTLYRKSNKCYMRRFSSSKLSQEGCFKTFIYYKRLCTGCFMKEAIDFQFHNSKSQECCFSVLDRAVLNGALRKKQS